jgi:thiamine-phosphate pyrophosphorylase
MDVALSVGADGVHLTSADILPSDARAIWAASGSTMTAGTLSTSFVVGVSCHSLSEVRLAESHGADFAVLAPIFEKPGTNLPPLGLDALYRAARRQTLSDPRVEAGDQRANVPIIALGGVTVSNAIDCIRAGASGVAGIRLFQQGNLTETVAALRQQI